MNESWIKIIEAAYPMFMESGYKGTATADIAKAAGINESTIFRNFKNKENLFQASIEHYTKKAIKIDFDILEYTGNLEIDLKRMIQTMFQLTLELIPSYRLLVKRSLVNDEILKSIKGELINQDSLFSHYLKGMQRREMIREIDTEIVTNLIYSQVFVSSFELLVTKNVMTFQDDMEDRIEEVTNFFIKLLMRRGD
ncbi:MAG: TetR/AcrR family transcriptional regulator [Clostridiaceae bacterium]